MADNSHLTCVFFSDLLPWERDAVEKLASAIATQRAVDIIDLPHRMKLETDSPVVWLVSRNWKEAVRQVRLLGRGQRVICSVMGLGWEQGSLFTIMWRKLWPNRHAKVELITHSPINFRFYTEIEGISNSRLSYLPLPFESRSAGIKGDGDTIGFFGSFVPESNLNYFMSVAHYVHQRNPKAKFRVLGAGPLYDHVIEISQQLGLGEAVTVSETVSPEEMKHIDILIYAPLRNDHFIPLFLGAAHGIPVLSSEIPGVSSFIQDGRNGFIVPTNETKPMGELAIRLMENDALRKFIGAELQRSIGMHYSLDRVCPEYAKLFFDQGAQSRVTFPEAA
jgi:glycosyltransferase involved in cell wall biosynthesis